jgi:predicted Zn-dependent protease
MASSVFSLRLAAVLGCVSACLACRGPEPRPARVLLIGIDAGDWLTIDPLLAQGQLPAFAKLRAEGRTGILRAEPPLVSPILWTSIATGRLPEEHGVLDFVVDLPGGGQAPVAATSRRVPALWNLFSRAGRSAAVVGWWASWPAETIRGTVVADRVAPQLIRAGSELDPAAISPPAARARLLPLLARADEIADEDLRERIPVSRERVQTARAALAKAGGRFYDDPVAHFATVVAATRSYGAIAEELLRSDRPDFLAVYFEAVDTVSHRFVRDPALGPAAIASAYRDVDALLTRLAIAAPSGTWIVLCSDHGFQPASAGVSVDPADLAGPATAWHRPYGIVAAIEADVLAGRAQGQARDVGWATPLDIAPSVLQAAGLPLTTRMTGHVLQALVPDALAKAIRPRDAVADATPEAPAAGAADVELEARLKALGYLGATTTSLARLNLAEILYRRGRLDAAERELRGVLGRRPDNLSAWLWLARVTADQNRPQEALGSYAQAARLPGGAQDALVPAATLAARTNLAGTVRAILATLSPAERLLPSARIARAILAAKAGKAREAESELRAALRQDPVSFEALSSLFDVLVPAGRAASGLPAFRLGVARAPDSPRHVALLGAVLLASHQPAEAETTLARALALAPDGDPIRLDLARAQIGQRKLEAALATLAPVQASADRAILRGAALSLLERWPEAAAEYHAALAATPEPGPELLNGVAWADLKQGKKAEAALLLDRSLRLRLDQPEIVRLRATLPAPAPGPR